MHLKIARYAQCARKSREKCNLEIVALFASKLKSHLQSRSVRKKNTNQKTYTQHTCTAQCYCKIYLFLEHYGIKCPM